MTIDDFDVNELSDKLAIREETDNPYTLEAAHNDAPGHDDGHNDVGGPCHNDVTNPPWHDDQTCGHDDGHYDVATHDDFFDDACPGFRECPT